jgi:hypothetical protein
VLKAGPGDMIFIGNGDTAACHHPAFDFNDPALPHGVSYWVRLVEIPAYERGSRYAHYECWPVSRLACAPKEATQYAACARPQRTTSKASHTAPRSRRR